MTTDNLKKEIERIVPDREARIIDGDGKEIGKILHTVSEGRKRLLELCLEAQIEGLEKIMRLYPYGEKDKKVEYQAVPEELRGMVNPKGCLPFKR